MKESEKSTTGRARLATGIPGLDTILHGGFPSGSVYIVRGTPGAGKTTLANQICFRQVAQGKRCLYITLLAESHDRLVENLQGLDFYDSDATEQIYYQSGFDTLEREGLNGILRMLLSEAKRHEASFIVVDGLFALQEKVHSEREMRLFVNQLQSLAHLTGSTVLLLTNSERRVASPEYTMVDGWMELGMEQRGYRVFRYLQVHKFRGSAFISGQHALTLSDAGVRVFPRFESHEGHKRRPLDSKDRLTTGIQAFDAMIGGGLRRGSNTLIVGATGIGKTALGLHFVSQSTPEEPGLIFGFYESEDDLVEKADVLAIGDLKGALSSGAVEVMWHPPTEQLVDELAYGLIDAVRRRGVKRLFVDGIDALQQSAAHPERVSRFLAALTNVLRNEGVTAMFTQETPELIGGEPGLRFTATSSVAQNIVLLRFVELASEVRRSIAVVKARTSQFDTRIREFIIADDGIRIDGVFKNVNDVLTGHAHPQTSPGRAADE